MKKILSLVLCFCFSEVALARTLECSLSLDGEPIRSESTIVNEGEQTDLEMGELGGHWFVGIFSDEILWLVAVSTEQKKIIRSQEEELNITTEDGKEILLACKVN